MSASRREPTDDHDILGHRAFALAREGKTQAALDELGRGWDATSPTPDAYGLDVARIHLLAGHPDDALATLALDSRSMGQSARNEAVSLVVLCVRRDRRLFRRGLSLALRLSSLPGSLLVPLRFGSAWLQSALGPATPGP